MIEFPKIKSFSQAAKAAAKLVTLDDPLGPVRYRGTVKLHGTNVSVVLMPNGELVAQSRNRVLSVEEDHLVFAAFVRDNEEAIRQEFARWIEPRRLGARDRRRFRGQSLRDVIQAFGGYVLFGEWVGPGIQTKAAVTKLPERVWCVFAGGTVTGGEVGSYFDAVAVNDSAFVGRPWPSPVRVAHESAVYALTVDFDDPVSRANAYNASAEIVAEIDKRCPWAARFGVEGPGEGVVWVPEDARLRDIPGLWWKHKGSEHRGESKAVRTVDAAAVGKAEALAEKLLEGRLEEGLEYLQEMGLPVSLLSMPEFLKRVGGEVKEECADEIEEAEIPWKKLSKTVARRAAQWFRQRLEAA